MLLSYRRLLTKPEHDGELRTSYAKYHTVINAISSLARKCREGTWPGRRPGEQDVIDMVISKSMWYSHYKPLFSKASKHPEMQRWLKEEGSSPTDYDIWGEDKGSYMFKDLAKWLEKKKGKGKQGGKKAAKAVQKKKIEEEQDDSDEEEEEEEEDKDKKKKKKKTTKRRNL